MTPMTALPMPEPLMAVLPVLEPSITAPPMPPPWSVHLPSYPPRVISRFSGLELKEDLLDSIMVSPKNRLTLMTVNQKKGTVYGAQQ
jgi:hypothetical protein